MILKTKYTTHGRTIVELDAPTSFSAEASNGEVTLTWTDPEDKTSPTGQTLATWQYTKIIRKTGSQPANANDGELVVMSSVKNQYAATGFVDTVENGQTYYYAAYAYTTQFVPSEGAFASATPQAGTALSQLAVGTLIKILENGAPVEYLIVNQGNPDPSMYDASCDGCWVLRYEVPLDARAWYKQNNDYDTSVAHKYLQSTWLTRYNAETLAQIKEVKIPYVEGSSNVMSGANGLSCRCFILSAYEVGWVIGDFVNMVQDGTKLAYFLSGRNDAANNRRVANSDNIVQQGPISWETRSPQAYQEENIISVLSNGDGTVTPWGTIDAIRPAMILESSATVDQDLNLIV